MHTQKSHNVLHGKSHGSPLAKMFVKTAHFCQLNYLSKMFPAAQNLSGPRWSDRWPPQHVSASSTAAWQHTWKVGPFCFYILSQVGLSPFPSCNECFFFYIWFHCIVFFFWKNTFKSIYFCSYRQLRRHLSLSMISKLLDGNCTYRPTEKEIQVICCCLFRLYTKTVPFIYFRYYFNRFIQINAFINL